jgi:hypothetical protein
MKKILFTALVAAATAPAMIAQSAVEAMQVSQSDFRGTARYMSMGGAFTALGGDLTAILQNPAGIGVYRRNEIGATVDLSVNRSNNVGMSGSNSKTKFACNNFGYVGVQNLGGTLQSISWGASFNRRAQFDRVTTGYAGSTATSLSNYIASFSNGFTESELNFGTGYNPYENGDVDWLSALAYNSYLINPKSGSSNSYNGLYQNGTNGDALLDVYESGYMDEYNFSLGGNISNTVFWGIGVGVTDLNYKRYTNYSESMENANAYNDYRGGVASGSDAGFELGNNKRITGTGWKVSLGVIVKPTNELRIGASVHTPEYWSLTEDYEGTVDYSYYDPSAPEATNNPTTGTEYTDFASFDWRLRSPWRFNVGVAGVIGSDAIVSVEYERKAYNNMNVKNAVNDGWGYNDYYQDNTSVNDNIHSYTRAGNIVRLGLEFRVTPQFSLRAGYNIETSSIKDDVKNGLVEVMTSSTDPSYSLNKTYQNVSVGLGYRWNNWYIDGAYVYGNRKSTLHPYTSFSGGEAPSFDVAEDNHSAVVSLGFKF